MIDEIKINYNLLLSPAPRHAGLLLRSLVLPTTSTTAGEARGGSTTTAAAGKSPSRETGTGAAEKKGV